MNTDLYIHEFFYYLPVLYECFVQNKHTKQAMLYKVCS